MFDHQVIIKELERNRGVFYHLLSNKSPEEYLWRPAPDKWNLLEITCHLYDEEREDFRARLHHVLETPSLPMPPINPVTWVKEMDYAGQDFDTMVGKFLEERENSLAWLSSLVSAPWENVYQHPKLGPLTAKKFLSNWLAHDYLHFRQINRYFYRYLQEQTMEDLSYAGEW